MWPRLARRGISIREQLKPLTEEQLQCGRVSLDAESRTLMGTRCGSPSGRTVRFPLPRGQGVFAAVARRFELDAAVLDLARAAGVKVHDGHGLIGASQDAGGVTLAVEGLGDVRARYAVGADGTFSPLARALGARSGRELGEFHAFRQYFGGVAEPAATGLWVFFEPDLRD